MSEKSIKDIAKGLSGEPKKNLSPSNEIPKIDTKTVLEDGLPHIGTTKMLYNEIARVNSPRKIKKDESTD